MSSSWNIQGLYENYLKFQRKCNLKCVQLCGCANLSKLVSFKVLGFSNFSHKLNVDFIIKPAHTVSPAHTTHGGSVKGTTLCGRSSWIQIAPGNLGFGALTHYV